MERLSERRTQRVSIREDSIWRSVAVRLTQTLVEEMVTKIEKITFWSDSTTVQHWIRQTSSTYKAFVGNRVSKIHPIMSNLEATLGAGTVSWRYVLTEANPADDITRGLCPTELGTGFRYSSGPKFLYESQNSARKWSQSSLRERWHERKGRNKDGLEHLRKTRSC